MTRTKRSWNRWIQRLAVVGICVLFATAQGCEPLRKKFVRKKKADAESQEVQPVLDPLDYPAVAVDVNKQYQYRYSLWTAWFKDMLIALEEKDTSEKKARHALSQMMIQLEEMENLLREGVGELLGQYRRDLLEIDQEFSRREGLRNDVIIRSRLASLDRELRKNFRFEKIRDQLR